MILIMSEKSNVQILLEARFQQLAKERKENNEVPEELRQEVFQTLDRIDEVEDINDLLTGEVENSTAEFLDRVNAPDNDSKVAPPKD